MSSEMNEPSAREQRVNEAIAAYLEAVDAGETPDPKELIAAHSDIAPELKSFFANRDEFERMAEPLQPADSAAPKPQPDDVTLPPTDEPTEAPTLGPTETAGVAIGTMLRYFGDYELLDEIARSGMGVVYKARQVSLNRIVALKMILAGQLASEEDVQRFHAEAEATPQELKKGWELMVVQLAAFREQRVVASDQYLGYDRVYVECVFEKGSIVFRWAFNSDKQMTGGGVVPLETVPGGTKSPNPPSP